MQPTFKVCKILTFLRNKITHVFKIETLNENKLLHPSPTW